MEAMTRWSRKSWGEILHVFPSERGDGTVHVRITSAPKLKSTMVDYGKGRENVAKIVDPLSAGTIGTRV